MSSYENAWDADNERRKENYEKTWNVLNRYQIKRSLNCCGRIM